MRRAAALAVVIIGIVGLASPAAAKGPSEGEITGEGIDEAIAVPFGEGTPEGDRLIEEVGFFEATFGQVPDRMLDAPPTDDLGAALTLRWEVPGPHGELDVIVQTLHPWADGGPLVHTEPGQSFFTTERTRGGWFRAPASLPETLARLGVTRPGSDGGGSAWAPIGASLAAVVLLGGALVAFAPRRRDDLAPAAT